MEDSFSSLTAEAHRLRESAQFDEALELANRAIEYVKREYGEQHRLIVVALNTFANIYDRKGDYDKAISYYKRALSIAEQSSDLQHQEDVRGILNNLGGLYEILGDYAEAESFLERSLALRETALGAEHPDVATALSSLGVLYESQARYIAAEAAHRRSLAIREKHYDAEHPDAANSLNNLAVALAALGKYEDAELYYRRSLSICELTFGSDHLKTATALDNLGSLLQSIRVDHVEAETLIKRSLAIRVDTLHPDHRLVGGSLNKLALLFRHQGRYAEAEPLFKRSLAITERALGPNHQDVAKSLSNLAEVYSLQGLFDKAEPLLKRAVSVFESALEATNAVTGVALNNLAANYNDQGRHDEALALYQRSLEMSEEALGCEHRDVASTLNNLALLHQSQERYADAERLLVRALAIREKVLPEGHADIGLALGNLAYSYEMQGRADEALPLYERSLVIAENALGSEHPRVTVLLENLENVCRAMNRREQAAGVEKRLAALPKPGTREMKVFFATNRAALDNGTSASFGNERSQEMSFGKAQIVLCSSELERLAARRAEGIGRLDRASGRLTAADKLNIRSLSCFKSTKEFANEVAALNERASRYKQQLLIFVHGYKVSFDEALLRAGQMAFDLDFDGAVMIFSWPSADALFGYIRDQDSARIAENHLMSLLFDLSKHLPQTKVQIVAHSMGNVVVLGALEKTALKQRAEQAVRFGEVILAHPDVDSHRFQQLAKSIEPLKVGLTLYANSGDWALWVSKILRGERRAGGEAYVVPGVNTIDTTGMGAKWSWRSLNPATWGFNHDVFVRDPILFGEITRLLLNGERPVHRRTIELQPTKTKSGTYWKFEPAPLTPAR